jgi:S1-C subfamily serine protease
MSSLRDLSTSFADAVGRTAPIVVRVDGEASTTGLVWADDLVVSAADDEAATVTADDGVERPAEVVGRDAGTGIAVLRVPGLAAAHRERSDGAGLRVGNLVLALARPGKSVRATFGMVTTLGPEWRLRGGAKIDRYIDTDIALPAEFGSTAVIADADGKLLGFGLTGRRHHRGVIVPNATLARVVAAAQNPGSGQQPYIGIATYPARIPHAQRAAAGQERGLMVLEVEEQSPAARGGLMLGDVVLRIGAVSTQHVRDLFGALSDLRPGAQATAQVLRGDAVRELPITVGARP